MHPIEKIKINIEPLRNQIIKHKVYEAIKTPEDLKVFMQYHVFAVWDFMSLLKALQNSLTCTSVPWFPKSSGDIRYLINEIVVGEECDLDAYGNRKSHFELYIDAMKQCNANIIQIETFIGQLRIKPDLNNALEMANAPEAAADFVKYTFDVVNSQKDHILAAVFTFGREDLIPAMFHSLINDIDREFPDSISIFKYYLERHIEVDGDHHSQLAIKMTERLCDNNKLFWEEAEAWVIGALHKRIALWNGAYLQITKNTNNNSLDG